MGVQELEDVAGVWWSAVHVLPQPVLLQGRLPPQKRTEGAERERERERERVGGH